MPPFMGFRAGIPRSKVGEHVDRFDPATGIYRDLNSNHMAVVDFRLPSKPGLPADKRDLHKLVYWAVVYNDSFTAATVHRSQVFDVFDPLCFQKSTNNKN